MKRKELILKWLDGSLNDAEQQAFKQLEDYDELIKISKTSKHFAAPNFDASANYDALKLKLDRNTPRKKLWPQLLKVAAVALLLISTYFGFFQQPKTTIKTAMAEQTQLVLPDQSKVVLNPDSKLTYKPKKWDLARSLNLEGEAFFSVTKGSTFTVQTALGMVRVLGTQFNVINRDKRFEVVCYEGLVQVTINDTILELPADHAIQFIDGKISKVNLINSTSSWSDSKSTFTSLPYHYVLEELERQYNVTISAKGINQETLFTGGFPHNDLQLALTAITQPMNLNFWIDGNQVTLKTIE